jgi:uncharacterized cysteine cluster protein YcgN (CxxCxxCC family)
MSEFPCMQVLNGAVGEVYFLPCTQAYHKVTNGSEENILMDELC